jgi:Ca2+-binding RTX toxin-like protein
MSPTGGNDVLDGGPGDDSADYVRLGADPLSLTLDDAANDGAAGETDNLLALENLFSGSGNDTIVGNASANEIEAGFGNDLVAGQGGNDILSGDRGQLAVTRGILQTGPTDDTLIGGTGRDALRCNAGTDVAVRDPRDQVDVTCERIGADVTGNSAPVTGKKGNKVKIGLSCPDTEGAACEGAVEIHSNGKRIGKGKFKVAAGQSKNAKAKLTKKGRKRLNKAGGSLLVSVSALTTEPGGVSESAGQVLIFR